MPGRRRRAPGVSRALALFGGWAPYVRVLQVRPAVDAWLGDAPAIDAIVHAAGFMRTGLIGALDLREGEAMWRLHVAAAPSADRTFIKPEEVAAVVRFLLSA